MDYLPAGIMMNLNAFYLLELLKKFFPLNVFYLSYIYLS